MMVSHETIDGTCAPKLRVDVNFRSKGWLMNRLVITFDERM